MATYTPKALIETKAFGNGSGNISTWQVQAPASGTHIYIARTIVVQGTGGSAGTVTLEEGTVNTATTAQQFVSAFQLVANTPQLWNLWLVIPTSSYLQGYASNATTNGQASGYDYA